VRAAEEQVEFERLFTQYGASLLDYLYGLTRNHEVATDLMQETFLRAWASATPLNTIQQPKAWLYRIATNLALNQSQRQRRLVWLPVETVEPNDYCADEAETPLYYARSDGSNPVRLFADQPLGRDFPVPRFSPDGTHVAWTVLIGTRRCESTAYGAIQSVSGGAVAALPDRNCIVSWRNDGAAAMVEGPGGVGLYTLASRLVTPLPGRSYTYVWGA